MFRNYLTAALRNLAYVTCGDWHAAEDAVANALTKLYPRHQVDRFRVPAANCPDCFGHSTRRA